MFLRWFTLTVDGYPSPSNVWREMDYRKFQPEYSICGPRWVSFVVCFCVCVDDGCAAEAGMKRRKIGRGTMDEARGAAAPMAGGRGGGRTIGWSVPPGCRAIGLVAVAVADVAVVAARTATSAT